VRGGLALATAPCGVVAQVARAACGEQPPAQDGTERRAFDDRAGLCGDVRGSCVGLLGGQPTELDKQGDRTSTARTRYE
jgi:hypothetical protein